MSENGSTTTTDKPKETTIATDKPKEEQWNVTTNVEKWGDQSDQGGSKRRRRRSTKRRRRRSTKRRRRTMRR